MRGPRSQHAIAYHRNTDSVVIHDVEMEPRSNIGNHVMQGQAQDKNGKLTNGNGDGQMKTVDENVKATVGNGDKQLLAEKNVKKADRNSVAQLQTKGKGAKVHAVKVPDVSWGIEFQVLGALALNLSLTNDIMDLKQLLQQLIGKTVHPAFFAVFGNGMSTNVNYVLVKIVLLKLGTIITRNGIISDKLMIVGIILYIIGRYAGTLYLAFSVI